ncbi:crotonase/enoyl-CoA hydratase family protein [Modestobacter versicolor]|uniref:crotonase/enoyl-CoA hydratase family protein n=1 Tax=Modestobacter versicolor TaxID=429133 RepID=UPI0034DE8D7F
MSDPAVLVDQQGATLVVTLNHPHVSNAVDLEMALAVAAAMDRLDEDSSLRVGVITGAGKHFCSGMDLKEFSRGRRPFVEGRGFAGLVERPPAKPLIAAVEGAAVAGGFEIVLTCDLVTAGEGAFFGLPEVKRGLIAAGGGLLRLPERCPRNVATELALTGGRLSAERAHAFGLVNRLVPRGESLDTALALAEEISANGPQAVRATKETLTVTRGLPFSEAFELQEVIANQVRTSDEAREGALAFVEKRAPSWAPAPTTTASTNRG